MGGCYSTSSQKATASPAHKQPKDKDSRHSRRKIHYTPVVDGTDQLHQHPGKGSISVSIEEDTEVANSDLRQAVKEEKHVVPSDSGIESLDSPKEDLNQHLVINGDHVKSVTSDEEWKEESLGSREYTLCQACHTKLQRINHGSCHHCGHFRIDPSAFLEEVDTETYCTCGPRQPGKLSTCRTHGARFSAASVYRHSDFASVMLKSNVNKERLNGGDSNYIRSNIVISGCVNGAGKEESDSRKGKVLFQAPLACEDFAEELVSEKSGRVKCDGAFLASKINSCHEALDYICKCDLSNEPVQELRSHVSVTEEPLTIDEDQTHVTGSLLELLSSPAKLSPTKLPIDPDTGHLHTLATQEEDDDDSGHGVSKSENRSESISDLDLEIGQRTEEDSSDISAQSSPQRFAAASMLETASGDSEKLVCPVMVEGRQMVMMDARTYSCMLNDLALLKEQLYNLTQVIQDDEMQPVGDLDLSLPGQ